MEIIGENSWSWDVAVGRVLIRESNLVIFGGEESRNHKQALNGEWKGNNGGPTKNPSGTMDPRSGLCFFL